MLSRQCTCTRTGQSCLGELLDGCRALLGGPQYAVHHGSSICLTGRLQQRCRGRLCFCRLLVPACTRPLWPAKEEEHASAPGMEHAGFKDPFSMLTAWQFCSRLSLSLVPHIGAMG